MAETIVVTIDDIRKAQKVIQSKVRLTPLTHSSQLSEWAGADCYLKYENRQKTGSFKIRGALNKLSSLTDEQKARGVVASSAGNHAQGVALSSSLTKVKATIVMPKNAPLVKIEATRGYGAEVILAGDYYDQAFQHAKVLEKEKGYVFVHPYDDPLIIAGQGTIGLELLDQVENLDCVIVSVGGGGMISGIATAVKAINPKCKVIGIQAQAAPAMTETFKTGKIVEIQPLSSSLADGVSVKIPSPNMYENYISRLVDDMLTIEDRDIAQAIAFLMERAKTVVEGSGALPVAAALSGKLKLGNRNAFILSGGNIDLNIVSKVIEQGLKRSGRRIQISVLASDVPGTLNNLTNIIAKNNANVLEVIHDRHGEDVFLKETKIHFVLETVDHEQIKTIRDQIKATGAKVI